MVRTMVAALRSAFDATYDRDEQFLNLQITNEYNLKKQAWPMIVISYENTQVLNMGVGHEEWFLDSGGVLRKWNHNRFEGTLTFDIETLTPLDRDVLADALVEVLRFGRLDNGMNKFFETIYGDPSDPDSGLLPAQIALNVDIITGGGNSEAVVPWNAVDRNVYATTYSCEIHGGYYNVIPQQEWQIITSVDLGSYPEGTQVVDMPFNDLGLDWVYPFTYVDGDGALGKSLISGDEEYVTPVSTINDVGTATGLAAVGQVDDPGAGTVIGVARPSGSDLHP